MLLKAREVPKICVITPKEREDMSSFCLPYVGRVVFFSFLTFSPSQGLEDKSYPAIDLSVNGESDGVSCISVEDCIDCLFKHT